MDGLRILESSPWAVVHDDVCFEVFDPLVGIWNWSLDLQPNFDPPLNYFWDYRVLPRELYHYYFADFNPVQFRNWKFGEFKSQNFTNLDIFTINPRAIGAPNSAWMQRMVKALFWSARRASAFEVREICSCVEKCRILKIPSFVFLTIFNGGFKGFWIS